MRWRLWRQRRLEERLRTARAEAEKSRKNLERTRAHVVKPLRDAGEQNHFADAIRDTLIRRSA